jgi:hypothetical protein
VIITLLLVLVVEVERVKAEVTKETVVIVGEILNFINQVHHILVPIDLEH